MRANTAERHELGLSSEPNTHFGQGSSNQAEGAQEHRVSDVSESELLNAYMNLLYACESDYFAKVTT